MALCVLFSLKCELPFCVQLLLQCLSAALRQEGVEVVQAHGLSRTLVKIHQVLGQAKPRLQHVLDMAACHGHAIQNLQEKRRDPQAVDPVVQSELVRKETVFLFFPVCFICVANISRVSNQNGVSLLYIMLEIHHSGREPSICM